MSGQPVRRRYLAFISAILIVAVLISAGLFLTIGQHTATETLGSTAATATVDTSTMTVDGSPYYADDVTKIMDTEGTTFHFDNGSVTFLGVEFQTICTDYASRCPGVPAPPPGAIFVAPSGPGITLNVAFPDHSSERIAGAFPIVPVYFYTFSHHANPQAGILIVYTNSSPSFKSYLLVSI